MIKAFPKHDSLSVQAPHVIAPKEFVVPSCGMNRLCLCPPTSSMFGDGGVGAEGTVRDEDDKGRCESVSDLRLGTLVKGTLQTW
jgi:hypothetical protein